jgi:hypothetical protein
MENVRRAYLYLVSLVSLQIVAWALIWLARDLLPAGRIISTDDTALQLALIVIGLPVYLVHWLWAQRLVRTGDGEAGAVLRRLYLYGVQAIAVAAITANTVDLLTQLLRLWIHPLGPVHSRSLGGHLVFHLVPVVVMAAIWVYHRHVLRVDSRAAPGSAASATVRRLYLYAFSAAGLVLGITALVALIDRLLHWAGGLAGAGGSGLLSSEIAQFVAGAGLWLAFWLTAQSRARGPGASDRPSVVRSLYLYLAIFASVLATVASATSVLAGLLRTVLTMPSPGGGGDPVQAAAIIIAAGLVWAYHALVLRQDARLEPEGARQGWIPRLYRYLVASVGLGAVLIGLGGLVSVLIRYLAAPARGLPVEFPGLAAVFVAGLPVWFLPWRRVQREAVATGPVGVRERRSIIRRIYLYFYIFAATMTVLGSGVYIVSRLIATLLGEGGGNTLTDLAQAIAYGLIAATVWLYHGAMVRADGRRAAEDLAGRLSGLKVSVVVGEPGDTGPDLARQLARSLPGLEVQVVDGATAADGTGDTGPAGPGPLSLLSGADVIIGPSTMGGCGGSFQARQPELAAAIQASPAVKLVFPAPVAGWHWLGCGPVDLDDLSRQAAVAIRQVAEGEEVTGDRRVGAGAIAGIVAGALLMLVAFALPIIYLLEGGII